MQNDAFDGWEEPEEITPKGLCYLLSIPTTRSLRPFLHPEACQRQSLVVQLALENSGRAGRFSSTYKYDSIERSSRFIAEVRSFERGIEIGDIDFPSSKGEERLDAAGRSATQVPAQPLYLHIGHSRPLKVAQTVVLS